MFHHTHTSIETGGKGHLRNILKDLKILTMRQSQGKTKKELRPYLHHTCIRTYKDPQGNHHSFFNELNIPFFHGQEAH